MNKYGFTGIFKAHNGKRDELAAILLQAAGLVSTAKGCQQYIINKDANDEQVIVVNEIWDTKEDHDHALKVDGAMALISQAMPLMDGRPESREFEVLGGKM